MRAMYIGSIVFIGCVLLSDRSTAQQPPPPKQGPGRVPITAVPGKAKSNPKATKATEVVDITCSDGFDNLCPNKVYTYGFKVPSGATNLQAIGWTPAGGLIQGSATNLTVQVMWGLGLTGGNISVSFSYTDSMGKAASGVGQQDVTIQAAPTVSKPAISGASSLNPTYLVPNQPATFTVTSAGNPTEYQWSVPGCFSVTGSLITTTPSLSIFNTGNCAAQVCVVARNASCNLVSPQSCQSFTRIPTLSAIQGPASFCKSATVQYCVDSIPGVDSYTWQVPNGWRINGSAASIPVTLLAPGGRCIAVSAPANLTANVTGTISVVGTVSAAPGDTAKQTTSVVIEAASPTALASISPTTTVKPTPNSTKKSVTIALPPLSFAYMWDYTVWGLGVNTKLTASGGGSRSVIMTPNQKLLISTYTKNSCGVLPGNDYAFELKNGALIPSTVQ